MEADHIILLLSNWFSNLDWLYAFQGFYISNNFDGKQTNRDWQQGHFNKTTTLTTRFILAHKNEKAKNAKDGTYTDT